MLWELDYSDKGFSLESAIAKGRPLPKWAENEPVLCPGDEFYIKAFFDLSSCREVGMGIGPIPWRDILTYAIFFGLEEDLIDPFIQIIREMDSGYLKWQDQHQKKLAKFKGS